MSGIKCCNRPVAEVAMPVYSKLKILKYGAQGDLGAMRSVGANNIQFVGLILAISLGLVGCAQSPTKAESNTTVNSKDLAIPPEFKDSTETEFQLGRLLKIYDDVAWLSTDALRAAEWRF